MTPKLSTSQRLLIRLIREGFDIPPCARLERVYRNHHSRIGAWSWRAVCPKAHRGDPAHSGHGNLHYGSHWAMHILLGADKLEASELPSSGDICIDPVFEDRREKGKKA